MIFASFFFHSSIFSLQKDLYFFNIVLRIIDIRAKYIFTQESRAKNNAKRILGRVDLSPHNRNLTAATFALFSQRNIVAANITNWTPLAADKEKLINGVTMESNFKI